MHQVTIIAIICCKKIMVFLEAVDITGASGNNNCIYVVNITVVFLEAMDITGASGNNN